MPPPVSNFLRTGQPDSRLAQSAGTPFDATARQVLDQQVVDVQTLLALLHANGVIGSYVQIDQTSPVDVAKGDVLCRSTVIARQSAVVATAANLVLAGGSVLGVALDAATKGSRCPYAAVGALPPEVTGLLPLLGSPSLARVSAVGRVEGVTSYGQSDTPLGGVDSTGWLTLFPGGVSPELSTGIFRGAVATVDATPTPILSVPFSDNAILTGTFYILAVTPPFGTSFFQGSSFGYTLAVVGGVLQPPIGVPVVVTSSSYVGPQPTFAASYAANSLSIDVTGIAATSIAWSARLDAVTILT